MYNYNNLTNTIKTLKTYVFHLYMSVTVPYCNKMITL